MVSGKKTISSNSRGIIDTLKNRIRFATNPFDGIGYTFKTAIKELREEGVIILHNKNKCNYYNPNTISQKWNY